MFESAGHDAAPPVAPRAITHKVKRDAGLVHVMVAGDVTIDALYAARDAIVADADYAPGMHFFVECRVITAIPSPDEIRKLALSALFNRMATSAGRVAIVATTSRGYEAASVFELFIDAPHRLAVFTDANGARAWLAVNDESDVTSS